MAQSILSISQKLSSLILDEADFLSGVQDQLQLLTNKIRLMRSALQDASEKHRTSKEVEEWLYQVGDVVMEAEDMIDLFIFGAEKQRLRNIPTRYIHYPNQLLNLHKLGSKIEDSNKKIEELSAMRSMLGLATSEATGQSSNEQGGLLFHQRDEQGLPFHGRDTVEEFSVIGFQEEENEIVKKLLLPIEPPRPFRPTVVSIVGMGGIGKTTLARKVFKNKDVMEHFPTRACYSVSQQCIVKDVLQVIIKQIKPLTSEEKKELHELDEGSLIHRLSNLLKETTYLIVFDDLWRLEHWEMLKQALPVPAQEEGYQSRVLLTTRNERVAMYADPFTDGYTHRLRVLTEEESWKLFLTKVMGRKDAGCPQDLEELGRKIVSKCHGLPLAIVVLGGLLSTKPKTHISWSKVLDSVNWELNQNEARSCRQVLALSYTDLPDQLKPCFLYVGLFPEDYEIQCSRLIWLWVAEGFIQPRGQSTMEDVAEDYMEELIKRSMIQATIRSYDGRVTHCRIHDHVRDLAISEAKQERFLEVLGSDNLITPNKSHRRLSIIEATGQGPNGGLSLYREALLNAIPKLSHLRILKLLDRRIVYRGQEIETIVLPASFSCHKKLYHMVLMGVIGIRDFPLNLTTLLLSYQEGQEINELMANLKKLYNLRCLILYKACLGSKIIFSADGFRQLEELMLIELNDLKEFAVDEGALPNLRVLKIVNCGRLKRLPQGLKQVVTLQELLLSNMSEELKYRIQRDVGEDWEIIRHIPFIDMKLNFDFRRQLEFWLHVDPLYYLWV